MDNKVKDNNGLPKAVKEVSDYIINKYSPEKVILFSHKTGLTGETTSFKLCVVIDNEISKGLEVRAYLDTNSDIPFDILIYSPEQWETLTQHHDTFASKLSKNGVLIYG